MINNFLSKAPANELLKKSNLIEVYKILKRNKTNTSMLFHNAESHLSNRFHSNKNNQVLPKCYKANKKHFGYKLKHMYSPMHFPDHYPVMWRNILEILEENVFDDLTDTRFKLIGDLTVGAGNHTKVILDHFENSLVLGVDLDKDMINTCENKLKKYIENNRLATINDSYVAIDRFQMYEHFDFSKFYIGSSKKKFDMVLLDLGYNSLQIDSQTKGFSFRYGNAELDMRYDRDNDNKSKASDILNHSSELELMEIFRTFGEEKYYEYLVKKIIEFRDKRIFQTVQDFTDVIDSAFHSKSIEKFDCYTRLFQALRMTVNYEILNIQRFLTHCYKQIEQGGLLFIITFHSVEDKYVKRYFKQFENLKIGKMVYSKAIKPSDVELSENTRSKSAMLRVFRFDISK